MTYKNVSLQCPFNKLFVAHAPTGPAHRAAVENNLLLARDKQSAAVH